MPTKTKKVVMSAKETAAVIAFRKQMAINKETAELLKKLNFSSTGVAEARVILQRVTHLLSL